MWSSQGSPSPFFWIIYEDVHKTLSIAIMFPMLELELRMVGLDMVFGSSTLCDIMRKTAYLPCESAHWEGSLGAVQLELRSSAANACRLLFAPSQSV